MCQALLDISLRTLSFIKSYEVGIVFFTNGKSKQVKQLSQIRLLNDRGSYTLQSPFPLCHAAPENLVSTGFELITF